MNKKVIVTLTAIYLIMLGLNFLAPLYYGDDLVYAFIWPNQFMNIPLPEDVVRVKSMQDIFISQWRHYFTGNGRIIAHLFVQFFVWQGKWLFNIVNALVFVILILQIHWISDRGIISFKHLRPGSICWTFFVLWTFVAGFWSVYLWLAGACNYLWSIVLLLFFLLPYIQKYFNIKNDGFQFSKKRSWFFLLGIIAGNGNENTICWIILALGLWFYRLYKYEKIERWMILGYFGLCIGYGLLILAPGNAVKTSYYLEHYYMKEWINIYSWEFLKTRLIHFIIIEYLQIVLWYFILTSLRKQEKYHTTNKLISNYCSLSKWCCILSLLFNIIMIISPDFPLRSGFASLVFLTIATSLLIRTQDLSGISFIDLYAKKLLTFLGTSVFIITLIGTYRGSFLISQYDTSIKAMILAHKTSNSERILEIPDFEQNSEILNWVSGQHLMQPSLSEDATDWMNVAVARYYNIKGIRTVRKNDTKH